MATCDVCGRPVADSATKIVRPSQIVEATRRGWVPSRLPGTYTFMGMEKEMWHQVVSRNTGVDWGLCQSCYEELASQ